MHKHFKSGKYYIRWKQIKKSKIKYKFHKQQQKTIKNIYKYKEK